MIEVREIENIRDYYDALCIIYSGQLQRYPLFDPVFLLINQLHLGRKKIQLKIWLLLKDGEIKGYVPFEEKKVFFVKSRVFYLPIQVIDIDYESVFTVVLAKARNVLYRNVFRTNYTDTYKELESNIFAKYRALKLEYLTHVVTPDWKPKKTIRQLVKKATSLGYTVDMNFSKEIFSDFFYLCFFESRTRKGIKNLLEHEQDLYIFFRELTEKKIGTWVFLRDVKNTIVSGYFLLYSNHVAIHIFGATSNKGLSDSVGYLNTYEAMQWCFGNNLELDLYGVHTDFRAIVYGDKTYDFKKKWGREICVNQYLVSPLYLCLVEIIALRCIYWYKKFLFLV